MSDNKIIDIDCNEPHLTGELICLHCGNRHIATWNAKYWLKTLYCPICNIPGYLIATGQILEYGDLSDYNQDNPRKQSKPGQILEFPKKGGHTNGTTIKSEPSDTL